MIKLLALLPLLALSSCSYPSKSEASMACYSLAREGGYFKHYHQDYSDMSVFALSRMSQKEYDKWFKDRQSEETKRRRDCRHEPETRQFLGYEQGREGKHYEWNDLPERRVKKRFSY